MATLGLRTVLESIGVIVLTLAAAMVRWAGIRRGLWLDEASVFVIASLPVFAQLLHLYSTKNILGSFLEPIGLEESVGRFNIVRHLVLALALAAVLNYAFGEAVAPPEKNSTGMKYVVMLVLWFLVPPISAWALDKAGFLRINLDRYGIASSTACVLLPVVAIH
jgi:hypothetical protein